MNGARPEDKNTSESTKAQIKNTSEGTKAQIKNKSEGTKAQITEVQVRAQRHKSQKYK